MPMKYEGLATVTVLALYADSPVELTTMELPILLKNVGVYRAGLEFDRYLHGPHEADVLRIELPGGWLLHARLSLGATSRGGGLEFEVEQHDLVRAPIAHRTDWKWT